MSLLYVLCLVFPQEFYSPKRWHKQVSNLQGLSGERSFGHVLGMGWDAVLIELDIPDCSWLDNAPSLALAR